MDSGPRRSRGLTALLDQHLRSTRGDLVTHDRRRPLLGQGRADRARLKALRMKAESALPPDVHSGVGKASPALQAQHRPGTGSGAMLRQLWLMAPPGRPPRSVPALPSTDVLETLRRTIARSTGSSLDHPVSYRLTPDTAAGAIWGEVSHIRERPLPLGGRRGAPD